MTKKLNTIEAAIYLGVKAGTMEVWRSQGKGPRYIKLGRRVVYNIGDLENFALARVVETNDSLNALRGDKYV